MKIKNLVLGNDLKALQFAFKNGYHVLFKELQKPFFMERSDETKELSNKDLIENYSFLLSLAGLNPYGGKIQDYRKEENNKIVVSGKKPWVETIEYENLYDFISQESKEELLRVVDWISVRSSCLHDKTLIEDKESNFVKEVRFYPSERTTVSRLAKEKNKVYYDIPKDIMSISYLTRNEVNSEECSYIYSLIKTKQMMKDDGLKGKKCGYRDNGNEIRASIKLEFVKREIFESQDDNIEHSLSLQSNNEYLNKITQYLYGR